MDIDPAKLGKRLRDAREACGLTQEEVAQRLGVSRSTVAQMEAGSRLVEEHELSLLAYLYGRDARSFFASARGDGGGALTALFRVHPDLATAEPTREALRRAVALGRELTRVERMLGAPRRLAIVASYALPRPSGTWEAVVQGEQLAHDERRRLGLGLAPLPDVAELLERQGVRTGLIELPEDVSGLTVEAEDLGVLVLVNRGESSLRRRFSFAHEYCHVLVDRRRQSLVSARSKRREHLEVRANAFAAAFLMPREAVVRFLQAHGKGGPRRALVEAFDEDGIFQARARSAPRSQDIHLVDVVLLANYFGVSRAAACYRLKSLRIITEHQLRELLEMDKAGSGSLFERLLGLDTAEERDTGERLGRRFLEPAFEAYRRGAISRRKLYEIAELAEVPRADVDEAIFLWGLDPANDRRPRPPED